MIPCISHMLDRSEGIIESFRCKQAGYALLLDEAEMSPTTRVEF